FEGAVRYLSGFRILHRYAYVVVPAEGDPAVVFPREARWVGDHGEAWMEQVFAEHPGRWIADQARNSGWKRIGVSGLDYVMAVRDYRALADGPAGAAYPEFKFPSAERRLERDDLLLYGLEIAGPGGHWVEFSRPICAGQPSAETLTAMDAYHEYAEAARKTMKAGATAHDVHMAVSKGFHERGFLLGHVTGHSIGMTMIEHPR